MQQVDLYQPLMHNKVGAPPILVRSVINTTNNNSVDGPIATKKIETYVLLSALPFDLQERIKTAIQMLSIG